MQDEAFADDVRRMQFLLPQIARALKAAMSRQWAQPDLTLPQLQALGVVREQGGCIMSDLASHLCVSLPTATGIVERLVKTGLLERGQDEGDRRVVRLTLTEEGRRLVEEGHRGMQERISRVLGHMSSSERRLLLRAMEAFHRAALAEAHEAAGRNTPQAPQE